MTSSENANRVTKPLRGLAAPLFVAALALFVPGMAHAAAKAVVLPVERDDPLADMAQAYFDHLDAHMPGVVQPLVDYSASEIPQPACDAQAKPKVHAALIGSVDAGRPFGRLKGPANDVRLLRTSLMARGVADADIAVMLGERASRAALAALFRDTLATVNCGDRMVVYFGGHSTQPRTLIEKLVPASVGEPFADESLESIFSGQLTNSDHDPTLALRHFAKSGLLLALDRQREGVYEFITARDLSDFATGLRNRGVDVVVIVDTSFASEARLTEMQEEAAGDRIWRLDTNWSVDVMGGERFRSPPLLPNGGDFAVLYGSIADTHSVELSFGEGDQQATYGVFTFRLASIVQNDATVTVRAMAEGLKALPQNERTSKQRYRVESTDPELVLFGDATLQLPQVDPITIIKPAPKRGGAAVQRAEVEIEGQVAWTTPVKAVLIDGKVADLREGGRFLHTALLKPGLNTIDIVALTGDGRTHQKRLDFTFEGDRRALEGDGRRYAVVIANETYDPDRTGFAALKTPFEDAEAVAAILTGKYGFVTEATTPDGRTVPLFLKDATRRDIETVLYRIGLVAGDKDTVLIYFAGHGIYEEKTTVAFWVPTDAEAGVPISYLSASTISEAVQRMQAGKVVIISDSCFSGALLRGGGKGEAVDDTDRMNALLKLSQRRSRVLISSGNNEPVEDLGGRGHSVFARALLTGLEDMQHDAFSARELFDGYILPLTVANADQEPQYRPIDRAGHEGGDIVFARQAQ